jgi:hypothetical protein
MENPSATAKCHFMHWLSRSARCVWRPAGAAITTVSAHSAFPGQQNNHRSEPAEPTLGAAQSNINKSRVFEITGYFRPNAYLSLTADDVQKTRNLGIWRSFSGGPEAKEISQAHKRQQKGESER